MTHFARSSLIVAVFFGLDKILGFIRTVIINRQFGLSYELDVFNTANNAPDLLSVLISGGALGVALIPVLSEYLELKGRPAAWDLFARIANLAFLVTASLATVLALIAPWLISNVIAPGFPPEQKALTVQLMRLDLFAILIFSISGLVMAGLHANQHFLLPALAPGLYNIGQIFGAAILAPETGFQLGGLTLPAFGLGIHGLVFGVILGAALHLLIQIPGLIRHEFKWTPAIDLRNPGVRQVLLLMGPRILTMLFIQLFFIVRDNLASGLGEGAVTALNNGWFIMQVPETLLGTTIAIVLLPTLSDLFALGDRKNFQQSVNRAVRAVFALTIPSAVLLAVGLRPLVQFAYGFEPLETEMVVVAARIYLMGLTGHALLEIASRSFYAQQNARIPLYAAMLNASAYVLLALFLTKRIGLSGIALANSIVFTSEAIILLWLLNRSYPGILKVGSTLIRVMLATAASATALYFALQLIPLPHLYLAPAGMLLGFLAILPLLWPEIRLLLRIGEN
ncbi:MAG: murein biosynthesis integral membrane protein MurJ [Anaerolineae bacterium]|nr:murein biosynthesis integral membrane protein MurJ [Anaerolineae bacterium]